MHFEEISTTASEKCLECNDYNSKYVVNTYGLYSLFFPEISNMFPRILTTFHKWQLCIYLSTTCHQ